MAQNKQETQDIYFYKQKESEIFISGGGYREIERTTYISSLWGIFSELCVHLEQTLMLQHSFELTILCASSSW